jgi:hypothetical protein
LLLVALFAACQSSCSTPTDQKALPLGLGLSEVTDGLGPPQQTRMCDGRLVLLYHYYEDEEAHGIIVPLKSTLKWREMDLRQRAFDGLMILEFKDGALVHSHFDR